MSPSELTLGAAHWAEDVGLLLAIGSFVIRRLGRLSPPIAWAQPPVASAFALAALGGVMVLVLSPGGPVLVRVAVEGSGWLLCASGRSYVAPLAVLAGALLAISGHASGLGAQFADAVHVLSAGMWAGGILALLTLKPLEGWASGEARSLVERFGRVAFVAFGITALTGVLRATEQLNAISDLWTTGYGVVLALKLTGVAVAVGLSLMWRRGVRVEAFEAVVVVAVVLATGVLAALPSPA